MNKPTPIPTSESSTVLVKRAPDHWDGFFTITPQQRPEGTRYKILVTIPSLNMYKSLVACTSKNPRLDGRYIFRAYYYAMEQSELLDTPAEAISWCISKTCELLQLELITHQGKYSTAFGGIIQYFQFKDNITEGDSNHVSG